MRHLREALQNIELLKQKDFLLVFLRFHSPLSPPRPAGVCRLVKEVPFALLRQPSERNPMHFCNSCVQSKPCELFFNHEKLLHSLKAAKVGFHQSPSTVTPLLPTPSSRDGQAAACSISAAVFSQRSSQQCCNQRGARGGGTWKKANAPLPRWPWMSTLHTSSLEIVHPRRKCPV